jgi:LPS sulfotransferase NodH
VVDRLALLSACAYAAMADDQGWDLWFAWERLAELAIAYEDLVTELSRGRRRLPSAF